MTGTVVDAPFTLSRRVVTAVGQGLLRIDDRVVNDSEWTAAAPLLYHVNLGAPVWDDDAYLETDAQEVVPRDEAAAAELPTWDEAPAVADGAPERVFEHVGASWARLTSPKARHRAHAPFVAAAALAVGRPGQRHLRTRNRAGELLGARPRARHRNGPDAVSRPGRGPHVVAHARGTAPLGASGRASVL